MKQKVQELFHEQGESSEEYQLANKKPQITKCNL